MVPHPGRSSPTMVCVHNSSNFFLSSFALLGRPSGHLAFRGHDMIRHSGLLDKGRAIGYHTHKVLNGRVVIYPILKMTMPVGTYILMGREEEFEMGKYQ